MPKEVLDGLFEADGSMGFPLYKKGKYLVEVNEYTKNEEKADMVGYMWKTTIIEGPEQDDGSAPDGKGFSFNVWIPTSDHRSYSADWYNRSVNQVRAMLNACSVKVGSDGSANFDSTVGKQVVFTVGKYFNKKEEEYQNSVNKISPYED